MGREFKILLYAGSVFFICAAAVFLTMRCSVSSFVVLRDAQAHDHKQPGLDQWFKDLKNSQGTPCCDGSEATHLEDVDWQAACEKGTGTSHYQVFLAEHWWNVPDSALVQGPNKAGVTLVWPIFYWIDGDPKNGISSVSIRCFEPGYGG